MMEVTEMTKDRKKMAALMAVVLVIGILIGIVAVNGYQAVEKKQEQKKQEEAEKNYVAEECVTLGEYKGIDVSLMPTEEDIQAEVDSLLEEHTEYEQKKGVAEEYDTVYAEFEGYVDGKKQESTCGKERITLGSGDWLPGFEKAFIGVKTGTKIEFSVDVPDGTYGDPELDGKTILFKAKLRYICGEPIVPEYNDEFVESISNYKTVKEYNSYLEDKLEKENEEDKLEFAWSEVFEGSKVNKYPEPLLKAARKEVLQGYYDMADIYGVSHDEIFQQFGCDDEQDFKDTQLEELAQDTVKEALVAEAVADKEGLSYTEQEYNDLVKEEYEYNTDSYDSKKEYEKENKEYLERTVLMNVVKKWLGENVNFIVSEDQGAGA